MEHNSEQLAKKFMGLPEDIKAAIWDLDLDGAIGEIGLNHKLHLDQIGELADQTALVLIGINPVASYEQGLIKALPGISGEEIKAIVTEVNQEIFLKIRESLQKVHSTTPSEPSSVSQPLKAPASATIFNEKMSKLFRVPREEVDLDHLATQAPIPPQASPATTDPYREPAK